MVKSNGLTWWIELCDKEVMLWSWFLKYTPIIYLTLTLDEILMSWCTGKVANANIYDHGEFVWLYDLTVLLMHDNIIDRLMTWIIMVEGVAHFEGEYLHNIPTPIIICIICIEDYLFLK